MWHQAAPKACPVTLGRGVRSALFAELLRTAWLATSRPCSRDDIKLLPSSTPKRGIWKIYSDTATQDPSVYAVAYTTFCRLWKAQLLSVILMKPLRISVGHVSRTAPQFSAQQIAQTERSPASLRLFQVERSIYKTTCKECEKEVRRHFHCK